VAVVGFRMSPSSEEDETVIATSGKDQVPAAAVKSDRSEMPRGAGRMLRTTQQAQAE